LYLLFLSLARQHGGLILRTAKVGTYFLIFNRLVEKVLGEVVMVEKVGVVVMFFAFVERYFCVSRFLPLKKIFS
jgi:hypothetical protein